jgi:phytoene dehydrogenase-like protein
MAEYETHPGDTRVGRVLVVGAGIGGMQAALDMANAGFHVTLVEQSTAIGGRMVQLDKTFPTNDCSMCIISPKLIEVDKHLNIDLVTKKSGDPSRSAQERWPGLCHPSPHDHHRCARYL